jgi:hypothetical protein
MNVTWRSLGALCRDRDWSKPRLLYELQNGLPYRTIPPGQTIDWHAPEVARTLDVEASTVTPLLGIFGGPGLGFDCPTLGIEVLPPTEAPPSPMTATPSSLPPKKNVSAADLRDCLRAIVTEHPSNSPPLDEETLIAEVERRLDATISRDRIRQARDAVAADFKLPPGRPRKTAQ